MVARSSAGDVNDINAAAFVHWNHERFRGIRRFGFRSDQNAIRQDIDRCASPAGSASRVGGHVNGPRSARPCRCRKIKGHDFTKRMNDTVVRKNVRLNHLRSIGRNAVRIDGNADRLVVVGRQVLAVVELITFVNSLY